jgi:hypothetical protein
MKGKGGFDKWGFNGSSFLFFCICIRLEKPHSFLAKISASMKGKCGHDEWFFNLHPFLLLFICIILENPELPRLKFQPVGRVKVVMINGFSSSILFKCCLFVSDLRKTFFPDQNFSLYEG